MIKYFGSSFIFTFIALALSIVIGEFYGGNSIAFSYFISCIMLGILEVAVSLDNAVVNATVLKDMDAVWRRRFLTWGMLIAVFGMRLIFPLAIVSVAAHISPIEALNMALFSPEKYEATIKTVHMEVMAFGGSFLLMVFAAHFINHEKEHHWIPGIGHIIAKMGKHGTAKLFIPILGLLMFAGFVEEAHVSKYLISAFWGVVTYLMVDGLGEMFEVEGATETVAKTGLAGFMYLEVLDASFSFDGVIAAFAITNNFLIIMLGLGIGAMFVRSLTIYLVEKDTLSELRYLEDGAFWGIGWLVFTMFAHILHVEFSEVAVAGGAAVFIIAATIHSIMINKKEKNAIE